MALPGIGPYAADNLLRLLGHYRYLGLDSWCRGKLKKLYPRIRDVDAFAHRRYQPFGAFAGLAMWLDLTRDWHDASESNRKLRRTRWGLNSHLLRPVTCPHREPTTHPARFSRRPPTSRCL